MSIQAVTACKLARTEHIGLYFPKHRYHPGQPYSLSLWLDSPDGATAQQIHGVLERNHFVRRHQSRQPSAGLICSSPSAATSATSQLQIGVRNDPSYFGFDDISITPISSVAPVIAPATGQPTVPIGGNTSFNVAALGSPPLAYQWSFNTNTPAECRDQSPS